MSADEATQSTEVVEETEEAVEDAVEEAEEAAENAGASPEATEEIVEADHRHYVPPAQRVRCAGGGRYREDFREEPIVDQVEHTAAVSARPDPKGYRAPRVVRVLALQDQLARHVRTCTFDSRDERRRGHGVPLSEIGRP